MLTNLKSTPLAKNRIKFQTNETIKITSITPPKKRMTTTQTNTVNNTHISSNDTLTYSKDKYIARSNISAI